MRNVIKVLSLVFVLSLTVVACTKKKECKEECKKECADKKECSHKKECKEKGDEKSCKPGCEKPCCKGVEADSATVDSAGVADEVVHVCTPDCEKDPHSCPHHSHEGHDHDH